jgi:hypothetical protein
MEKGLRRKFLSLLADRYRSKTAFKSVATEMVGTTFPSAISLPAVYLAKAPESHELETNVSKKIAMLFDLIIGLSAPVDCDLVKSDLIDEAEEVLMDALKDSAFRSFIQLIEVLSIDASATALYDVGIQQPVLPPYGVVRIRFQATMSYNL